MKRLPAFLLRSMWVKFTAPRPQASFLPLAEDNREVGPLHQPSLHKTLAIMEKQAKAKDADEIQSRLPVTV